MLYGQKVVLRAIEPADLPNYVRWINDPEVREFMLWRAPMALAQEERWYEQHLQTDQKDEYGFAIDYEGQHIGGCGLHRIDWRNRSAEFGIFIGEKGLWGQGLGSDATRTLIRFGFEEINLHRINLHVFADNARAIHIYESVGFVHEGRERDAYFRHGHFLDILCMSILAPEWVSLANSNTPNAG